MFNGMDINADGHLYKREVIDSFWVVSKFTRKQFINCLRSPDTLDILGPVMDGHSVRHGQFDTSDEFLVSVILCLDP